MTAYVVRVFTGVRPTDPMVEECWFDNEQEAELAATSFEEERPGHFVSLEQESSGGWDIESIQEKRLESRFIQTLEEFLDKVPC